MFLKRLELVQFKNHGQVVFDFSQKINIFIGKNGVGKTNILDAIYYLSVFRSHLQSADQFNIGHGHEFFRLLGQFSDNYYMVIKYALRQKNIEIKGVKVTKYSEHFGHLPLVLSSPSDIFLLHDGSEERQQQQSTEQEQVVHRDVMKQAEGTRGPVSIILAHIGCRIKY